jgi:hypothetical protein
MANWEPSFVLRRGDLARAVRYALMDSAWPMCWRVEHWDVMACCESLARGVQYVLAGDTWTLDNGAVVRVSHSHKGWCDWLKGGKLVL